jgi:hypothetical protein
MISEADYTSRDATALAKLVRRGEVSPQELLDAAIARIERLNPRLNAVVEALFDAARRDIADGLPDGPFAGVPFLVKDLHTLVKGSRLSHGCAFFAGHVSSHDSSIVAKARGGRTGHRRAHEFPGIRPQHHDRITVSGTRAKPLEPGTLHRRIKRRQRGIGGFRDGAAVACHRQRRLDPDPRILLRPDRAETDPWPGAGGAGYRRRLA